MQVGGRSRRGDCELLKRFVELGGIGCGGAGRQEVKLCYGEVLGRSVKLDNVRRSP